MNLHFHRIMLISCIVFNTTFSHNLELSKECNSQGEAGVFSPNACKNFSSKIQDYKDSCFPIISFINRFAILYEQVKNSPLGKYDLHSELLSLFIEGNNSFVKQLNCPSIDNQSIVKALKTIDDYLDILICLLEEIKDEKKTEVLFLSSKILSGAVNTFVHYDEVLVGLSTLIEDCKIFDLEKTLLMRDCRTKSLEQGIWRNIIFSGEDLRCHPNFLNFAFHYPFFESSSFSFSDPTHYSLEFAQLKKILLNRFTGEVKRSLLVPGEVFSPDFYYPFFQVFNMTERNIFMKFLPGGGQNHFENFHKIEPLVIDMLFRKKFGLSLGMVRSLKSINTECMKEVMSNVFLRDSSNFSDDTLTFEYLVKIMGFAEHILSNYATGYEELVGKIKDNINNCAELKKLLAILEAGIYYRTAQDGDIVFNKKIKNQNIDLFVDCSNFRTLSPFLEARQKDKLIACCSLSMEEIEKNPESLKEFQQKVEFLTKNVAWNAMVGIYYANPLSASIRNEIEKKCKYPSVISFRHTPGKSLNELFAQ